MVGPQVTLQIVTAGFGTVFGPGLRTTITRSVCWVIFCVGVHDDVGISTRNRPVGALAFCGLPPQAARARALPTTATVTLLLLKARLNIPLPRAAGDGSHLVVGGPLA